VYGDWRDDVAAALAVRGKKRSPRNRRIMNLDIPSAAVVMGCASRTSLSAGWSFQRGYMLLGQIAEARCTQVLNPKYTYICKVDKRIISGYFG
jgi:hypothetical protein